MADDDKEPENIEEDFDDFGFADDSEEDELAAEGDDEFGAEVTEPTAKSSSDSFSDELLEEMEKAETKKPAGFDYEAILTWVKENKLIAGSGAGVAAVIFVFTMMGDGSKPSATAPSAADLAQTTPSSAVSAAKDKSIGDFFKDEDDSLDSFEYKAKEQYQEPEDAEPEQTTPAVVAEKDQNIKKLEGKISGLEGRLHNIEAQLNTLQGLTKVITQVSGEMNKRDHDVTLNQKNIKRVEAAITALNGALVQLKRERFRSALLERAEFVASSGGKDQQADYIVMASIPGRAWLRNQDGVLITVREGEDVPGFGRVKKIDPASGEVIMADNTVFKEEE